MHAKRNKPGKHKPKSVDRCAAKLIALLDTGDYSGHLSVEQRRTARDEMTGYLDQVGPDAFKAALHKLYVLAAQQVRRRADILRGRR